MPTNTVSLRIDVKYDGDTCYAIPRMTKLTWSSAKQFMRLHGHTFTCELVRQRSKALRQRFHVNPRTIMFRLPVSQLAMFSVNMRKFLDEHPPVAPVEFNPWQWPHQLECQPAWVDSPALAMST